MRRARHLVDAAPAHWPPWRIKLHDVIFGHEAGAGRYFDVALIVSIIASVIAVMLDSVAVVRAQYGPALYAMEWLFTIVFTVEYSLRLLCAPRPAAYARSFFGLVDVASILPTYLSLILPGAQYLQVIRVLRVLRVFRVLKLAEYIGEADTLMVAIRNSRRKLSIFIATVLVLAVILGAAMYIVEGGTNGFNSIPSSIYWTIVTITTVGYGDIAPETAFGKTLASIIMLLGYAIVAVPTGIVTVELTRKRERDKLLCDGCGAGEHDSDARHCKRCGSRLTGLSCQRPLTPPEPADTLIQPPPELPCLRPMCSTARSTSSVAARGECSPMRRACRTTPRSPTTRHLSPSFARCAT